MVELPGVVDDVVAHLVEARHDVAIAGGEVVDQPLVALAVVLAGAMPGATPAQVIGVDHVAEDDVVAGPAEQMVVADILQSGFAEAFLQRRLQFRGGVDHLRLADLVGDGAARQAQRDTMGRDAGVVEVLQHVGVHPVADADGIHRHLVGAAQLVPALQHVLAGHQGLIDVVVVGGAAAGVVAVVDRRVAVGEEERQVDEVMGGVGAVVDLLGEPLAGFLEGVFVVGRAVRLQAVDVPDQIVDVAGRQAVQLGDMGVVVERDQADVDRPVVALDLVEQVDQRLLGQRHAAQPLGTGVVAHAAGGIDDQRDVVVLAGLGIDVRPTLVADQHIVAVAAGDDSARHRIERAGHHVRHAGAVDIAGVAAHHQHRLAVLQADVQVGRGGVAVAIDDGVLEHLADLAAFRVAQVGLRGIGVVARQMAAAVLQIERQGAVLGLDGQQAVAVGRRGGRGIRVAVGEVAVGIHLERFAVDLHLGDAHGAVGADRGVVGQQVAAHRIQRHQALQRRAEIIRVGDDDRRAVAVDVHQIGIGDRGADTDGAGFHGVGRGIAVTIGIGQEVLPVGERR
ncbi:hypothetical protein D3C78_642380 [compost metagenome]